MAQPNSSDLYVLEKRISKIIRKVNSWERSENPSDLVSKKAGTMQLRQKKPKTNQPIYYLQCWEFEELHTHIHLFSIYVHDL